MIQLPAVETIALAKNLEAQAMLKSAEFRFRGQSSSRINRKALIAINVKLIIRPRMAFSVSLSRGGR